jgi:hypothetical protein
LGCLPIGGELHAVGFGALAVALRLANINRWDLAGNDDRALALKADQIIPIELSLLCGARRRLRALVRQPVYAVRSEVPYRGKQGAALLEKSRASI